MENLDNKKIYATISADIVGSTSLPVVQLYAIQQSMKQFIEDLEYYESGNYCWGRVVHGDSIEIVMDKPAHVLRAALLLKCKVKTYYKRYKGSRFDKYRIRIAMGVGEMRISDKEKDMMDGEAIYLSGRTLNSMSGKKEVENMVFVSKHQLTHALDIIAKLADACISSATSNQCNLVYHKLLGKSSDDISKIVMNKENKPISVSAVNKQLVSAQWQSLIQAVNYFEKIEF
ncbi:MAG: hypothetical protein J6X31_10585 [Bacteroidales bacterium]|nr:hypothetical protein [Bacteroidales bacterium]MBP5681477.1 hypothetical protein [Bacteroidales bacterium]